MSERFPSHRDLFPSQRPRPRCLQLKGQTRVDFDHGHIFILEEEQIQMIPVIIINRKQQTDR